LSIDLAPVGSMETCCRLERSAKSWPSIRAQTLPEKFYCSSPTSVCHAHVVTVSALRIP
jgi:hypothetical protein